MSPLPPLVLAAHGSPHPAHRPAVDALRDAVVAYAGAHGTPDPDVRVGWLDFFEPRLDAAARAAADDRLGVAVVPLLLAAGHHARIDVPARVAAVRGAVVSDVLGPHPLLAAAAQRRLAESGAAADAPVVLAAAGSSDPGARGQVEQLAVVLAELRGTDVRVAFASGPGPGVATAVAEAGPDAVVATYLLSPGALAERVAASARTAGATIVSGALGSAPEVVELVVLRWHEAAAG